MRSRSRKAGKRKLIGKIGELTHGTSKKFILKCGANPVEAVLINYEGDLYAYLNRCRHIPISLDWVDNHFFSEDKRYLICANHGATYDPKSGVCVWGPCGGEYLESVPLDIMDEKIYARCPAAK